MSAQPSSSMRELHRRFTAGVHVRLLWSPDDGRTAVVVLDTTTGEAFQIDVRDGERPLDVFHHPYAYAGWHGIRAGSAPPAVPVAA